MQLYDYQIDMLHRIEAAFKLHQSVMVQMPTGTGKTCLLASCVYGWMDEHEGEVWIVAHRRELVEQIRETVERLVEFVDRSGARRPLSQLRVMSIQWVTRHYKEIGAVPGLIVIDEAHHALAKTYAEVMNAFPKAKKLGVTATPCRLTRNGFTDLFEVLLASKPISEFIKEGYLADFDYVSLNPDSEDQKKIDGLKKRATDGDYNIAEMQEVLDTKPTIERLFKTVGEFAEGKKGIVYAINIEHAEHIAEYYRGHGLNAVAISSKTPLEERTAIVENFRNTNCHELSANSIINTPISVLVNVDLFGEGFDCPDVEFIQLARPTLSLAKYLQMVGRGLRVAKNKECCTILDNVGLYRLFGLPNADRDWKAMFLGKRTGKGGVDMSRDMALRVDNYSENYTLKRNNVCDRDMVVITRHDAPRTYVFKEKMDGLALFRDEDDNYYTKEGAGNVFKPISLETWKAEKKKWRCMVEDFENRAEEREKTGVFKYQLPANVRGYKLMDYIEPVGIRISRNGKYYNTSCFDTRLGKWIPTGSYTEFSKQAYGIRVVRNGEGKYMLRTQFFEKFSKEEDPKFDFAELLDEAYLHIIENGREYYVDIESRMCFDSIPELVEIGFVRFQKDGDMYFPFDYRLSARKPFRRGEIVGGEDICFIGKHIVLLKDHAEIYYIRRRYTDGKRFIVSKERRESIDETLYDLYYDGKNAVEIKKVVVKH